MTTRARGAVAIALFCVFFATPVALFAQPGVLSTLTIVEVKPDMVPEFEELQKEFNAAARRAGVTDRTISQVVRGPATEYYILAPVNAFADYDEPNVVAEAMGETGWAQWVARVTKTVQRGSGISSARARSTWLGSLAVGPGTSWGSTSGRGATTSRRWGGMKASFATTSSSRNGKTGGWTNCSWMRVATFRWLK